MRWVKYMLHILSQEKRIMDKGRRLRSIRCVIWFPQSLPDITLTATVDSHFAFTPYIYIGEMARFHLQCLVLHRQLLYLPVLNASQVSASGQTRHFGDWGVHWIARNPSYPGYRQQQAIMQYQKVAEQTKQARVIEPTQQTLFSLR